jgi:hypothetical protein
MPGLDCDRLATDNIGAKLFWEISGKTLDKHTLGEKTL